MPLVVCSRRTKALLIGIGLVVLAPLPAAAQARTAACQRDLLVIDSTLREAMQRLEAAGDASDADKCAAYRSHIETMRKASAVFARCTTGREREENVGQMNASVADFQALIRARCDKP
ncbi:hypothetical protein ACFQU1_02465 [Chelatococcus sp. GCM10030263]|uniref:hypothetical protein n=1 Tax=Chelatococcus sp. GCM10030263 TaxID=3273387 RepID=UPI00361FE5AF